MRHASLALIALICVLSTSAATRCRAQQVAGDAAPRRTAARGAVAPSDPHLVVRQWVQPSADGALHGRVVLPGPEDKTRPVAAAHVALVGPGGTLHRATCDADGKFAIAAVPQGVYALTAQGDGVFAAYALHVVAGASHAADYPDQVEIAGAAIDRATVKTSILRYLPPRAPGRADRSLDAVALDAMARHVCANVTSRVVQVDGGLQGVIRLAGADGQTLAAAPLVNVFISQAGQQVARTVTDDAGRFTIEALAPGSYSLLAVGPGGLGSVGFELMTDGSTVQASRSGVRLASFSHDPHCSECFCDSLGLQIAPLPEIVSCVDALPVEEVVVAPPIVEEELLPLPAIEAFPPGFVGGYGGGFAGGYGGGGGGFYGGGGWAGLAALGGIAAAIAADDDDDGFFVPLPLSPAAP